MPYSQDEIEEIIRTVAGQYGVPYWVALGIAGGESSLNPELPGDNGKSYGLFQIHEIHGVATEKRKDPWFNATWAMQNSVGPAYHEAKAQGITDPTEVLRHVWLTGQRAAGWAVEQNLPKAVQWAGQADDWQGGTTMVTPDMRMTQGVTGEPAGGVPSNFEKLWGSLSDEQREMWEPYIIPTLIDKAMAGPTTTQQTYDVQDAQAQRMLDEYVARVNEGEMTLNQALAEISRETAVTSRTETMGQEQRAMWDMQLAPGTEHQPGFGPQGAIGALQQKRGAEFQPRPVTTVPTAALSAQGNLQQAQQSIPQVPPMNMPQYPQLPPPSGMGPTTTTTQGSGFADDLVNILGMGGPSATPSWWTPPMARPEDIPERIPPNWWEMLQQGG